MEYGRLTVPEVGVFERKRNSVYELNRLDLVGGGFRLGLDDDALFPMTDAQGNVRGYISRSGWKGMHAYYPFGSTVDFVNQQGEDERRWQGKEFDGEHGKYYFGARYYDPFLGLWMSPDPAGQFMNPYSYGGDPLNYVDPNGEEALSAGVVVTAAIVGAISGGVGSSLELSETRLGWAGWAGRTGGELLGSAASSVFNTVISGGGNFWDYLSNMGQSMAMGLTSSILTGYLDSYVNDKERYDYTDVNEAGLQVGDVLAFGVEDGYGIKNWAISRSIMTASGEPYSHIAVVDYGLDKGGDYVLGIREANNNGTNQFTSLSEIKETNHAYNNRKFKILGNKSLNKKYTTLKSGKYGLVLANCAVQGSYWTNMPYRNNPGAFARMMLNQSIYYNSASLRSILW